MYKALDKVIIFRALDKVIIIYNVKLMWKCIPYQGRTLFIGPLTRLLVTGPLTRLLVTGPPNREAQKSKALRARPLLLHNS